MKNPRLKDVMGQLNHKEQFFVSAFERLLGDDAVEELLDEIMPVAPTAGKKVFGRSLATYSGLSRAQLQQHYGFSDDMVDTVYAELGVVETREASGEPESTVFPSSAVRAQKAEGEGGVNEGVGVGDVAEARPSGGQIDADGTLHAEVLTKEEVDAKASETEEAVETTESGASEEGSDSGNKKSNRRHRGGN